LRFKKTSRNLRKFHSENLIVYLWLLLLLTTTTATISTTRDVNNFKKINNQLDQKFKITKSIFSIKN